MNREERILRDAAAGYRAAKPTWAQPRPYLARQVMQLDTMADVAALFGLDLSDLYRPTPGERWRPLADGFASAVDAAREATP